jgi:hypothetical protein
MKKVQLILEGTGGELDRVDVEMTDTGNAPDGFDGTLAAKVIATWTLAAGDVIRVQEVEA